MTYATRPIQRARSESEYRALKGFYDLHTRLLLLGRYRHLTEPARAMFLFGRALRAPLPPPR